MISLEESNKIFNEAKDFLKTNYPNGYHGNGTYPLYLFYDKGFKAIELTSSVQDAYWVFNNKKFNSAEDMICDLMCKY